MITCRITIAGWPSAVTWEQGVITGDAGAVGVLRSVARQREGREIGMAGFGTTRTNHLASGASFFALCELISDTPPTITVTGDEPDLLPTNLPEDLW